MMRITLRRELGWDKSENSKKKLSLVTILFSNPRSQLNHPITL